MKALVGKKRRVLIIVENLPVPFDRRVWQEATTLHKAGYAVSVISPQGKNYEKSYEKIEGIDIYRHPLRVEGNSALTYLMEYFLSTLWQFFLSFKILKKKGFDVVQACNPPDLIFLVGLFYKLLLKKHFIFDHHDINPELYLAKFGRKDHFYRLMLLMEKLSFKTADLSIATNNSYKAIAISRGGMTPDKVTVVRSGPSLERMILLPPDPRWRNGKKFVVGYLGVMGKQEGVNHLLKAASILTKRRDDVQFVLVGGGTELAAMKKLSGTLGLNGHVTFTGRIPDQPMLEALNTADICVNPDIANEMNDKSTMNKIMEYMALGKPIVQYDLKEGRFSAREASLYAEKNNFYDLAEKIDFLLEHPELRKEMGAYGRARVLNELNWEVEAPKYINAYNSLK